MKGSGYTVVSESVQYIKTNYSIKIINNFQIKQKEHNFIKFPIQYTTFINSCNIFYSFCIVVTLIEWINYF